MLKTTLKKNVSWMSFAIECYNFIYCVFVSDPKCYIILEKEVNFSWKFHYMTAILKKIVGQKKSRLQM